MLMSSLSSPFSVPYPSCAISSIQIACTAKESYLGGPKVCPIADLPYFGVCVGEAFLQRGQALQQHLGLFFFFNRVIPGKVQVKLVLGDGERRQKAVSLFTATRSTVWLVPSLARRGPTQSMRRLLRATCFDLICPLLSVYRPSRWQFRLLAFFEKLIKEMKLCFSGLHLSAPYR